jgi:hypothetical protein
LLPLHFELSHNVLLHQTLNLRRPQRTSKRSPGLNPHQESQGVALSSISKLWSCPAFVFVCATPHLFVFVCATPHFMLCIQGIEHVHPLLHPQSHQLVTVTDVISPPHLSTTQQWHHHHHHHSTATTITSTSTTTTT